MKRNGYAVVVGYVGRKDLAQEAVTVVEGDGGRAIAVEALTLILARELRGRDVTVNTVAPGPTASEMFFEGKDEETIARLAAAPPLERLGTPADIAEVVAFLAGPRGHWVNGQTVRANGGLV